MNSNIGSGNGLAPNMWQAIIWTSDGLVYWLKYASFGHYELNGQDPRPYQENSHNQQKPAATDKPWAMIIASKSFHWIQLW